MENHNIEISWGSLWRVLFFATFVVILFQGRQVLLGLFLAIIISSGLEVIINFLEKHKIPRTLSVVFIFLTAVVFIIFVVYLIFPQIIVELNMASAGLKESALGDFLSPFIDADSSQSFGSFVKRLSSAFFEGSLSPLSLFSRAVGGVGLAIAVLVSSFYLSISRDGVERFLRVILPLPYESRGLKIYERSKKRIGHWFQTQILLSFLMGVLVWVSLAILGVKHAFLLGLLAAIFELVPYVGPILSGAAAILVAFSSSPTLALYVLIVFIVLHQLESNALVPILMKKAVGLHPVIVIIALLIGVEIWGFFGIVIAVPAAAVFEEVVDEWSVSKKRPVAA